MGEEKPRVESSDEIDIGADEDLDLTEAQSDEVVGGASSAEEEEETVQS